MKRQHSTQRPARALKIGSYTVAVSLVAIAVAVLLNVLLAQVPASYTRWDMTQEGLYTLSDQTRQIVSGLNEDVTVYLVAETGSEDETILQLLDRYQALSPHIRVVRRDPVLYPAFLSQFTDTPDQVSANSLVVESGRRATLVDNSEIYLNTYSYYYYYQYVSDRQFAGESALTTAIDFVTTAHLPTVYQLTGHGEAAVSDALSAYIAGDNMELKTLNLLSEEAVPADADCMLINAPATDLSADEAQLLAGYLDGGGSLLLLSSYTVTGCPNLLSVLADYGMEPEPGLILEGSTARCYRYRNYLLPELQDTELTHALYEGGYQIFAPNAHGVRQTAAVRSGVTLTPLLTTSAEAYTKLDAEHMGTGEKEDGDASGPFQVGMAASEEHDGLTTRLVWLGSAALADESIDALVSGADSDLLLGALGWMCQRESSITIHTKSLNVSYLTMDDASANLWSVVFMAVIPLLLAVSGAVIMMRRRKR